STAHAAVADPPYTATVCPTGFFAPGICQSGDMNTVPFTAYPPRLGSGTSTVVPPLSTVSGRAGPGPLAMITLLQEITNVASEFKLPVMTYNSPIRVIFCTQVPGSCAQPFCASCRPTKAGKSRAVMNCS